jgi:hypothetical protein
MREGDFRATRRSTLVPSKKRAMCLQWDARRHGILIDRDFTTACRHNGVMQPSADRCSVALARRLENLGWLPLRTQVPVSSTRLNFASYIDVVCVDRATGQRLCLVEVKASTRRQSRACYDVSPRRARDLTQLAALRRAVREQSGALLRFTRMDKRVSDAVIAAVEELLHETANDPGHPLRVRITEAAREFAAGLREDQALQARVERIMADTLTHPAVADFAEQGWRETKTALLADAGRGEDSQAGRALADGLMALGQAILTEDESRAAFNARLTPLILHLAEQHGADVARLISETVASWDAATVVEKIEAGVGRDLQYIRLNGTLIGGLIGVVLHAIVTMT